MDPTLKRFVYNRNGWGGGERNENRPETGRLMAGNRELMRGPWGLLNYKKREMVERGEYRKDDLKITY